MQQRLGIGSRLELAAFASLLLFVAISPLGREATHPVVLGLTRTLLLTIVAVSFIQTTKRARRICPWLAGGAALVFAAMLASVVFQTGSRFEGAYQLYENILFLAAFYVLALLSTTRTAAWKYAVLAWVVIVDVVYVAAAFVAGGRPLQATFVNPNYFASFLLCGLSVCAAVVFFGQSTRLRTAAAIAGLFLYYGIGQAWSRGATLAALGMLVVAVVRSARRAQFGWISIVGAMAGLFVITIAANPALVGKFMDRGQHDPYNYQRTQIWKASLQVIQSHPILGVGLGRFRYQSKQFTPAVEGTIARYRKWPNIAHNEYLQYAAEIGIPAAMLLFGIAGWLLALAWRRAKNLPQESRIVQEAALCTAAALGIHALVDNNWTFPVLAAGLAVISQADLLPQGNWEFIWRWTPVRRTAFAFGLALVFIHSTLIPAAGLYFNEAGHQAYIAENFSKATIMHRFAVGFLPDHPVLLDNLGLDYFDAYMKTRKPELLDRAESLFNQSMAANRDFEVPAGHLETVLIQRLTGDPSKDHAIHAKIIEADRTVLRSNPFNPFIRKNLAEALYNLGDRQQAHEELKKATEMEPNYVAGYLRLADWARENGRPDESEEYRKKAIAVVVQYHDEKDLDPFDALLLGRPQLSLNRP
jgi:O-antigen ligase